MPIDQTRNHNDQHSDEIRSLLRQMTLEEKVSFLSGDLDFWKGIKELVNEDYYHKHPFPAARCARLGLSGLHFIDGPRGVVLEGGATTFPVAMARGASWDIDLEQRIGDAIGREHRSFGGNLFGGVCVNILRHPAWGRAQETYGEDTVHLGAMAAATVQGVEPHVNACIKHFAANSMENARFKLDVRMSDRALHEVYLPHFKDCVDAGASSVMSAYNALNGEWCGQNKILLRDILKDRWGFKGYVLTDFIFGMRDPLIAIDAGLDLEMPFRMLWGKKLLRLVKSGEVSEYLLDEPISRLISAQLKLASDEKYPNEIRACAEHIALAREAAAKSIVLLKNDNNCLPIKPEANIVVIGELADTANLGDRGSSDGRPEYVITPLAGLQKQAKSPLQHFRHLDERSAHEAVSAADCVIIVAGYTHYDEGEYIIPDVMNDFVELMPLPKIFNWMTFSKFFRGIWHNVVKFLLAQQANKFSKNDQDADEVFGRGGDRDRLTLSARDEKLIKDVAALNKSTVVTVMAGSAVIMESWKEDVAAIAMLWYPGMEGGNGLADIIFGKISPSGRLPFTIPTTESHLPPFEMDAEVFEYDLWHGYRFLERNGDKPAFPFGFGLGYSSFKYSPLELAAKKLKPDGTLSVSLTVTNTGAFDAEEVVQLYIGAHNSAVEREIKSLKAFRKILIKSGKTEVVHFDVPAKKLAYFSELENDFVVELTDYDVFVGRHSQDSAGRSAKFTIKP